MKFLFKNCFHVECKDLQLIIIKLEYSRASRQMISQPVNTCTVCMAQHMPLDKDSM